MLLQIYFTHLNHLKKYKFQIIFNKIKQKNQI